MPVLALRVLTLTPILVWSAYSATAFVVSPSLVLSASSGTNHQHSSSTAVSATTPSRRDAIWTAVRSTAAAAVTTASVLAPTRPANADVDYAKIQDLLGSGGGDYSSPYVPSNEGKRPTWLTEPTDEFKENERIASDFKRKNLQNKQKFAALLESITTAPNDEAKLATSLDELRRLVKLNAGLPIGITKEEVVKTCRRRKSKKYWPTNVEIAYQDLLYEISMQQSPNVGRDMSKL